MGSVSKDRLFNITGIVLFGKTNFLKEKGLIIKEV